MVTDDQKATLRQQLASYVQSITKADRKAGARMYICPLCGSGTGKGKGTKNGAFSIKPDGLSWHCFSCEQGGDIFTLIGLYEGLADFKDQLQRAADLYGIDTTPQPKARKTAKPKQDHDQEPAAEPARVRDYSEYIERCRRDVGFTDYFRRQRMKMRRKKRMNKMTRWDPVCHCYKAVREQEQGRSVIQELGVYESIHEKEIEKAVNIGDIRDMYFTGAAQLDPYWENFGKEKIKTYEEKQTDDEIKVGDEVIYNEKPHNGKVGLVIGLCEKWVEVRFKSSWNCVGVYRDTVTKTGRSFPQIAEVLKQIDGGE